MERIARAKYQDNLELIQWFKRYYDVNCGGRGDNYPAEERRGFVEPDFGFSEKVVIPKTYNGNGDCTYNASTALVKPKRQESEGAKKQPNLAPSNSQNQNQNWNANGNGIGNGNYNWTAGKGGKTQPSLNDKRIGAIREILGSGLENEEKLEQINEIVNQ